MPNRSIGQRLAQKLSISTFPRRVTADDDQETERIIRGGEGVAAVEVVQENQLATGNWQRTTEGRAWVVEHDKLAEQRKQDTGDNAIGQYTVAY